ncbi:hypothetical protein V6N11_065662 [Hibiscus sabdariffa]|uniref:Uncharacterized protein n=1 Tax=Hibiscus sabdariffa TaxID=183260 RepID=A0ABR2PHZ1_9ROSI
MASRQRYKVGEFADRGFKNWLVKMKRPIHPWALKMWTRLNRILDNVNASTGIGKPISVSSKTAAVNDSTDIGVMRAQIGNEEANDIVLRSCSASKSINVLETELDMVGNEDDMSILAPTMANENVLRTYSTTKGIDVIDTE